MVIVSIKGKMRIFAFIGCFFCLFYLNNPVQAQQYHAFNGSPYAGAISIFNNPASSVNNLHKWDLNLFSIQTTISTNHLLLENFSYRNPMNTVLAVEEGTNSYYGPQSMDLNLLGLQYQINKKSAFTVGLRGRMYNHFKSDPFAFNDTISSTYSFFRLNRQTPKIGGFLTHTGYAELNLNYAQELLATPQSRLTGGITLQIDKAISGGYTKVNHVTTQEIINGIDTNYVFIEGRTEFAYSDNYDLNYTGSASQFAKAFVKNSKTGIGLSLGLEYTTYKEPVEEGAIYNPLNYDWKFGFSIMDIGANKYKPSNSSGIFSNPNMQLDYASIENKFSNVTSINEVKDSLKTLFNNYDSIYNNFSISKPTRIILNIDKNLGNHFALNAQLNMNLYSTSHYTQLHTRETNLITITPRWENIAWGFYLPVQYNSQGQLWIGAAVKMGPLLLGFHDFSGGKTIKRINGGGYLSISIHPFNKKKVLTRLDCPD